MTSMTEITIVVPGEPVGKGRPRMTKTGNTYTPVKTATYENLVKLEFQRQCPGHKPYEKDVPLEVIIEARFAPANSVSKRKRMAMIEGIVHPTKVPDADNIAKAILDALHGVCYLNDSSVVRLSVVKVYACIPCVVVEVRELV